MQRTIPIRFTDEMLDDIDALCEARASTGITRSQVIRELISEALSARKKRPTHEAKKSV